MIAGDGPFSDGEETSIVTMISRIVTRPVPDLPRPRRAGPRVRSARTGSRQGSGYAPPLPAFGRALQQAQRALGMPVADMTLVSVTLPAPDPTVAGGAATTSGAQSRLGKASPTCRRPLLRPWWLLRRRRPGRAADVAGVPAGGAGETPKKGKGPLIAIGAVVVAALVIGGVVIASKGGGSSGASPTDSVEGGGTGTAITSLADAQLGTVRIVSEGDFVLPDVGKQLDQAGEGTGFIIDGSGLAVTNNHVVAGAATLQVFVNGDDKPRNARESSVVPSATTSQ